MAFAAGVYGITLRDALKNVIALDLTAATHKVAMYTNTLTPNFNTDASYSATNEVTGTGYTAGGTLLVTPTLVVASRVMTFDAADTAWASSTISNARGAIVYADALSTPTADPLIVALDFGSDYSTVSGTFTIQWSGTGLFTAAY